MQTNLGQVYRHVRHDQIKLMGDGYFLLSTQESPCFVPGPGPVLDGDISDDNVLTLNFTNGNEYARLTSELHMDVDDNKFEGTFTGTICGSQFYEARFTARRHLPFSGEYHRQGHGPGAYVVANMANVTFEERDDHSLVIRSHEIVFFGNVVGASFTASGIYQYGSGQRIDIVGYHDGLDWRSQIIHIWGSLGSVAVFSVLRQQ